MEKRSKLISTVVRWILTSALLILVWAGIKWALYLSITLIAISLECVTAILNRRKKK